MSPIANVTSGVPQGSVLGPLLFILFINDLPNVVSSPCKLFADDTKIYGPSENYLTLQGDVASLLEWSEKWQLHFNISKCKTLHIGKNNPQQVYYGSNSEPIAITYTEKDVGVVFDRFLNFDQHINNCVNRANRMIGIIFRAFVNLDIIMFLPLYKSLIRSILEYANCIWSPVYKRQSICVENVQRRATRLIVGLHGMTYEERLKYLDLPSLKFRRLRGDLIQLYKLVHGFDNLDPAKFFKYSSIKFTRGDRYKIYMSRYKTRIRQNSFIQRTLTIWNNLKFESKDAKTVNAFKASIDKELIALRFVHD